MPQVRTPGAGGSLADRAYLTLRDRLVLLEITPGAPMNEALLVAELGMGRTPVREALKRLEVDHLVTSYPRQGTFASAVDIRDLAAVSEMRAILEPIAARRAAELATGDDRDVMRRMSDGVSRLVGGVPSKRELIGFDLAVHRQIYGAVGNVHMQETLVRLDNLATRLWWTVLEQVPDVAGHVSEHVALLRAIASGEADRAEALAYEHVIHFDASVRRAL